ncbi:MAG: DUF4296 domain-containing protein [Bacteroidales bacterium]|nr:DUF4296 domain-containing protein [Bacteroidales bacterium]
MRLIRHIALLVLALAAMASCGRGEHIISRGDMARIYADMYMTDQWILVNPDYRRLADTTLVYNPVFEKYGYDTDDYIASVRYYMRDPERFSKILKQTSRILDAEARKVAKLQEAIDKASGMRHPDMWDDIDFSVPVLDSQYVRIVDTSVIEGIVAPEIPYIAETADTLCVE